MSVKLELYRVFKEVAEAGNITAAAQALYISQSAVSQSIKQLEGELQTRLFARNSRGVALTPDGRMLYEYVRSAIGLLETGKDLGGNELVGEPPKFAKGAVVSPCSDSVDAQLVKMERKVKAGAEFFQTQAVFEPEKFIKFMEAAKQFGKPVQVGIIIPKSVGMCRFMNNNVAGVHIPDELIAELQADKEKTKAGITGVEIAARIIRECKPYCQGVHIMSLGWESKVPGLLEQAGLK